MAMASNGETLKVLNLNNQTISEYKPAILREIKFMVSLRPETIPEKKQTLLNFAMSNIDSVILLFSFNTATQQIIQKTKSIIGFSSPVCRMTDLFSITNRPLLAAGDENGEVSIFDYEQTVGKGLKKVHQSPIAQLLTLSGNMNNISSSIIFSKIFMDEIRPKLISLGLDYVLVIYALIDDEF